MSRPRDSSDADWEFCSAGGPPFDINSTVWQLEEHVKQLQQVLVVGSGGAGSWFRIDLVYFVSQMKRNGKVRN